MHVKIEQPMPTRVLNSDILAVASPPSHHHQPRAQLVGELTAGPAVAMELTGPGARDAWPRLAAEVLGAGGAIGSASPEAAAREAAFFFGAGAVGGASFSGGGSSGKGGSGGSSLALIKPHAVAAGHAGAALEAIQARLGVAALRLVRLDAGAARELLDAYRGGALSPGEWAAAVAELSSGPALAVEVTARDDGSGSAVEPLRALAGPRDPAIARALRPDSLRARFGDDGADGAGGGGGGSRARNGVHCTDLEEDGALEVALCFCR